jgi:hypothetical protein
MSTIKSSNEHLTFNADGTSKEIRFQANGTQKASISSAGLFTSTTIDATKLTGTIPSFTSTGIDDNADAIAITIDSSERVGIGTTSPDYLFEVESADNALANFKSTDANSNIRFTDSNSTANGYAGIGAIGDDLTLIAGNDNRVRIDSSGNVGIGAYATNPPSKLYINNKTYPTTQANAGQWQHCAIGIPSTTYVGDKCVIGFGGGSTNTATDYAASYIGHENKNNGNQGYGDLIFGTRNNTTPTVQPTERMRIKSDGDILMNTTSNLPANDNVAGSAAYRDGLFQVSRAAGHVLVVNIKGTTGELIVLRKDGSIVGTISTNGSSTSYNTSSDHRLKENVVDMENATDRVKQLKPKRFNFIADDSITVDGFLAHEVSSVVPEAISGTKDEVDDDGNAVHQGIDQSKLVPLLVKTIQELEARITAGGL